MNNSMPNRKSLASLAKKVEPKKQENQKDIDVDVINASSVKSDFTKREQEEKIKARNEYPDSFSTRTRAGMKDVIECIVYNTKLTQQEVFERAILAYLEKEELEDGMVKYKQVVKE